jgi:hypothetical protein
MKVLVIIGVIASVSVAVQHNKVGKITTPERMSGGTTVKTMLSQTSNKNPTNVSLLRFHFNNNFPFFLNNCE